MLKIFLDIRKNSKKRRLILKIKIKYAKINFPKFLKYSF